MKVVVWLYVLNLECYGKNFRYDEFDLCASKKNAIFGTLMLGVFGVVFVVFLLCWFM